MYLSGGHGSTHNYALLFAIHFHIHGLIASSPEPGHWVSGLLASMTIAEPGLGLLFRCSFLRAPSHCGRYLQFLVSPHVVHGHEEVSLCSEKRH